MNINGIKSLTIFTPTYNRVHTLERLYESLKRQTSHDFKWLIIDDGSIDGTMDLANIWIKENKIGIEYIYKENGGLYTGYNMAYDTISTELCVCVDSDDYLPDNAVESVLSLWSHKGSDKYAGIIGLDFDIKRNMPVGGKFPAEMEECFFNDLYVKRIHRGDTKLVLRTSLMKEVCPMTGFPGEKHFNPVYLTLKVCDTYPLLVINDSICFVEYQDTDSMSANIFRQYIDSPRSFSKLRLLEMQLSRNSLTNRIRVCTHYIATSIISGNMNFIKESPLPILTTLLVPLGIMLHIYFKIRTRTLLSAFS